MKKFNFMKILYYGFMIFVALMLALILPSYNQFQTISKSYNNYVEDNEFKMLPGFFSTYYDEKSLTINKSSINDSNFLIYDGVSNVKASESDNYTMSHKAIGGIILGTKGFDLQGKLNTDTGNTDFLKEVIYKDIDGKEYHQKIDSIQLNYISTLDTIYFELSEYEYKKEGLNKISNIEIKDNKGNSYAKTDVNNLDFSNNFYKEVSSFIEIYNRNYTNLDLSLNGEFKYSSGLTSASKSSSITFNPSGATRFSLDASSKAFTVTGANYNDGGYYISDSKEVKITFDDKINVNSLTLHYTEEDVVYSFNDKTGTYNFKDNTEGKTFGGGYDIESQKSDYNAWKESYLTKESDGYVVSRFDESLKNTTLITVLQIIAFMVIVLIIGDFIVGKRRILHLISSLFARRENKKNEVVNVNYLVNVSIEAHTPEYFDKDITLRYKKDDDNIIDVVLKRETSYKYDGKYQNGKYKLQDISAEGLHVMRPQKEVLIKGYNFKFEISLADNDGNSSSELNK